MKEVIMNDGTEKTVTDKHARRLLYYEEAVLKEGQEEVSDEKEEKKTPANKKDKTKKETK